MKSMNNSGRSDCTIMKIEILADSDTLNNIQLIMEADLLGLKCSNYALKLQNGKKTISWYRYEKYE